MFHFSKQSFANIPSKLWQTILRFPLTVIAAIVFTVTGFIMAGRHPVNQSELVEKLMYLSLLALPLCTAAVLLGERFKSRAASIIAQGIALIPVGAYFFVFDTKLFSIDEKSMAFFASIIAAYLLLLTSPFFLHEEISKDDAWHFDRALITRFLFTFVYGLILFLGLIAALSAARFLFELRFFVQEWYFRTWIIVVGVFGVLFFLYGVPKKDEALLAEYPKPVRILFFGILLPLLGVFTIILYAYVVRMLVTWSWPKDGVAQWVLGFSAVLIGCFLIAYPLLALYGRLRKIFFALFGLFIPLLTVLFIGIGIRIAAHGATINRLIVLMLGIWITAVVFYALIFRLKVQIKYIPLSLAVFIALSSFGPWSIFNTAARNQLGRLEWILIDNKMLKNGMAVRGPHTDITGNDAREIFSIMGYLSRSHELRGRRAWLDTVIGNDENYRFNYYAKLQTYFGLRYSSQDERRMTQKIGEGYFYLTANDPTALSVEGYAYMIGSPYGHFNNTFTIPGKEGTLRSESRSGVVKIFRGDAELISVNAEPLLQTLVANRYSEGTINLPDNQLQVDVENQYGKARLYITRANFRRINGRLENIELTGVLLFTLR